MKGTIAIIPARGGSKRIPGKNIRRFAGLPMIAHSIRTARAAGVFERIIVSTDSAGIAAVAREHGAEVPFLRPRALAGDLVGTDAVILHALGWLARHGVAVRYFCCIYATAPLMRPADLRSGLQLLRRTRATTAFSVTTYPYPIFRSLKVNELGRLEMLWPENHAARSQDLLPAYHDAGQFYWGQARRYRREGRVFSKNARPVFVPRNRVQDIDTPEDWEFAEQLYRGAVAAGDANAADESA